MSDIRTMNPSAAEITEPGQVGWAGTVSGVPGKGPRPPSRTPVGGGRGGGLWQWLVTDWHWPMAVLFAAVFLLAVLPVVAFASAGAIAWVFLQLPAYMFHQYEEHAGDRFRRYVNRVVGRGKEALTPGATFWINSLGVWGVNLAALHLAWLVTPAAGLAAGYLAVVNGITHIVQAAVLREYNPGLATAALVLVPVGGGCVWAVGAGAGLGAHAVGLGAAVAVHGMIVGHVAGRLARLSRATAPSP